MSLVNRVFPLKNNVLKSLSVPEIYTLSMLLIYTLFSFILFTFLPKSYELIIINLLIGSVILFVSNYTINNDSNRKLILFRRIYLIPAIFLIYTQVQNYIRVINPYLYDDILIKWDKNIFGVNPTEWLYRITCPELTEYMAFCYMLYFFLPLIHGIELHIRRKDEEFDSLLRLIIFTFYFSYLLYFFMPAVGPRFTVHNFSMLGKEMPGLWITDYIRAFINAGGGIPIDSTNPALAVNRDCMPSGHTMITLVNIILTFRYRSKTRWIVSILGFSLIFATVYLRYHYVVDVFAGVIFAFIALKLEPIIGKILDKKGFRKI